MDRSGLAAADPGIETVIELGMAWLGRAQDHSRYKDGGVARHYSLETGWGASYPETTGYIIPTVLDYARIYNDRLARDRAISMLDWLKSIQLPGGGFQGSVVDAVPVVPVTFNTGQILIGLAHGVREFGEAYRDAMEQAAGWLVSTQDADGCWRKHPTPFASGGEKAYETHVAWGLLEAARSSKKSRYAEAALANVRWALAQQQPNGWFANCCLTNPARPLTHTLGYALRGVVEAHRYTRDRNLLAAAIKTANGLMSALQPDGCLPGRLLPDWGGAVSWVCLTGTVQIAHCWLMLFQDTGDPRYLNAATRANRFVRRTIKTSGPEETLGAVKGSFPVDGEYCRFQFPNWACKFMIDANLLEQSITTQQGCAVGR